jgi:hypothetical protein
MVEDGSSDVEGDTDSTEDSRGLLRTRSVSDSDIAYGGVDSQAIHGFEPASYFSGLLFPPTPTPCHNTTPTSAATRLWTSMRPTEEAVDEGESGSGEDVVLIAPDQLPCFWFNTLNMYSMPDAAQNSSFTFHQSSQESDVANQNLHAGHVNNDLTTTNIMIRNIPNGYTRSALLELLKEEGFGASYDFVYLPGDFSRWFGLGYAFVNMVTSEEAERVIARLEGYSNWTVKSCKVCEVRLGEAHHTLEYYIERFRNSPVMHRDVPDEFKPAVFVNGERVAFPPPTKSIRPPRPRAVRKSAHRA